MTSMTAMGIGPMLRAMRHNKTRVLLVVLQIAFTAAVVLNCLAMVLEQRERMNRPTGIAEEQLIAVSVSPFAADYRDDEWRRQVVLSDLDALRALPGVDSASVISNFPLLGGGSSTQARPVDANSSALVRTPVYRIDTHMLETLDLELVAGRAFDDSDLALDGDDGPRSLNVIVTEDLALALFPDGNAVGQEIFTGSLDAPDRIVGVVDYMFTPYGGGPMETRISFAPGLPSSDGRIQYLVRAEAGAFDEVFTALDPAIMGVDDGRVVAVQPLVDIKAGGFFQSAFLLRLLTSIIVLLVLVTAIGIFGVTSFSVTRRTKMIGTRRALGATRSMILQQFLLESSLIAALGLSLGLAGAFALNVAVVANAGGRPLDLGLALAGLLALWVLIVLSTWLPAHRASTLSPALATRTV